MGANWKSLSGPKNSGRNCERRIDGEVRGGRQVHIRQSRLLLVWIGGRRRFPIEGTDSGRGI